jgi:hypothetical protein
MEGRQEERGMKKKGRKDRRKTGRMGKEKGKEGRM